MGVCFDISNTANTSHEARLQAVPSFLDIHLAQAFDATLSFSA